MPPSRPTDRAFGFILTVFFAVLTLVAFLIFDHVLYWAPVASATALVIALTIPSVLLPLNLLWNRLNRLIHLIVNHVLLFLFYCVVVCPAGLLMRIRRYDPMHRGAVPGATSYFRDVERRADPETFRETF